MAAIATAFVVSRVALHAAGVTFEDGLFPGFWHSVDVPLLKADLARSILYLHAQPPLMNLGAGLVFKAFGDSATWVFPALFQAGGLGLALTLWRLQESLGVPRELAVAGAIAFAVSPASLLYENFLFYTYPVTAMLCGSAWLLHRAMEKGRSRDWLVFFGVLAAVVLTRSLFHLAWLLACLAACVSLRPGHASRILKAASVPVLVVLLVHAKNQILFGGFSTSSWLGMSLGRMTTDRMDPALRARWIREGYLSPIAAIRPYRPIGDYEAVIGAPSPTGVPVLDLPAKSTGELNLHHGAYVEVSRRFLQDAVKVIVRSPGEYLRNVRTALRRYFDPATDYHPLNRNRARIRPWEELGSRIFRPGFLAAAVALAMGLALLAGLGGAGTPASRAVLLFMGATILYVTATGTALEIGENNRFRFMIEPFVLTIGALGAARALDRLRAAVQESQEIGSERVGHEDRPERA